MMYALVWRRDNSPGITWYIRNLTPDYFYGEVGYKTAGSPMGGRATVVSARLTIADRERVAAILAELSEAGPTDPGPCFALLGRFARTLGEAEVVFKYEPGAEERCPRARRFLELHAIIEAYLAEAYKHVTDLGPAANGGA
jgi:hypothetical protein